jgi:hypothetical protein
MPKSQAAPTTAAATVHRAKRASFRPRPSMENAAFAPMIDMDGAPRWPGIKEEPDEN